ncbi:hypothetical protein [Tautonia marina]|uniref:hypothetical protein n=1 Tax=Tautonia marina TaxID=2653855 RepID=UPI0012612428|nr:hypothetical protein [Tautonia marina]
MNLVRIGSIYVNFDRVAMIRNLTPDPDDPQPLVRLEFGEGHHVDVTNHATELLQWVEQRMTDVTDPPVLP